MYRRDRILGQFIQDYYYERHNQHFYVRDWGFICYRLDPESPTVIIDEFYVRRESRRKGFSFEVADTFLEYCKRNGCTHMIGFVDKTLHNGEHIERLFKAYGLIENKEHSLIQPDYLKYEKQL